MSLVEITIAEYDVDIDLLYATDQNFTEKVVYRHAKCCLHPEAAEGLKKAILYAAGMGLRFKIFDAFRPHEAQVKLFEHTPDPKFVSHPTEGMLPHCRGVAIDLTLVDKEGKELEMGTAFDAFTPLSYHGSTEVSEEAQRNRYLFAGIMKVAGFDHHPREWWHYQLPNYANYPVLTDEEAKLA